MMKFSRVAAGVAAVAILAGCGGGSNVEDSPSSPSADLPSSIPLGTGKPVDVEGEVIIFRNTLEADAVASTLDHSRTFSFNFDPAADSVVSVSCSKDGALAAYLLEDIVSLEARVVIGDGSSRREYSIPGELMGGAVSPDGSQVAVSAYLPENQRGVLSLLDVASGEITSLYNRPGGIGAPRWSPDGTNIVFHALTELDNQLFVHAVGGTEPVQVTHAAGGAFSPDWSPDGDILAFMSITEGGNPQIFTAPAAGGDATQLTGTQIFKAEPRWSADGSRIAYVGTILVPTASRLLPGRAPVWALRMHNVAVYTSARDGSDEVAFTDITLDAWLLGWCQAGPWLGQGWTEQQ